MFVFEFLSEITALFLLIQPSYTLPIPITSPLVPFDAFHFITLIPVILSYIPLLSCLPISSCWLCMLPYSGLCRGRLERLRCSGGDWQCSRHHTQPGRKTSVCTTLSFPLPALPVLLPLAFFSYLHIFPRSLPSCPNFALSF